MSPDGEYKRSIDGWPALLLFFVPCLIGWAWIITTLLGAVL